MPCSPPFNKRYTLTRELVTRSTRLQIGSELKQQKTSRKMKGGLGKREMCAVCVCVLGPGTESEVREREGPLPRRALGARGLRAELVCNVPQSQQVDMAVLLLYTLQLAVNTVKAAPPPHPCACLCFCLYARRCTALLTGFPQAWRHPSGAGRGGARESSRTEHPIQGIRLHLQRVSVCVPHSLVCLMPGEAQRAGSVQALDAGLSSLPHR